MSQHKFQESVPKGNIQAQTVPCLNFLTFAEKTTEASLPNLKRRSTLIKYTINYSKLFKIWIFFSIYVGITYWLSVSIPTWYADTCPLDSKNKTNFISWIKYFYFMTITSPLFLIFPAILFWIEVWNVVVLVIFEVVVFAFHFILHFFWVQSLTICQIKAVHIWIIGSLIPIIAIPILVVILPFIMILGWLKNIILDYFSDVFSKEEVYDIARFFESRSKNAKRAELTKQGTCSVR